MSLLMDALKKAEQAKRLAREQGHEDPPENPAAAPSSGLTLAPLGEVTAPPVDAEALARTMASPALSIPDSDFLGDGALSQRPPAPGPKPETSADRGAESGKGPAVQRAVANAAPKVTESEAIRNVFVVKEARPDRGTKNGWVIGLAVLTVLTLAGIGGYVWWQLQPKGLAALPAVASVPAPASSPTVAPLAAVTMPAPSAALPPATAAPTSPPAALSSSPPVASRPVPPAPSLREARAASGGDSAGEAPVLRRSREPLRVSPQLQSAYEALARGDLGAARGAYELAWQADPQNSDALHGLATIALREGRPERAEHWFQLALRANPRDALALAGLAELAGLANPAMAETRLRALAADFPDQPAAQIALGNLYGRQARWSEAQEAYFAAYALQPANADVLFNLAISLEHLNQPRLAQRYYAEALKAHQRNPGRFEPARVEERLRELEAR